MFENPIPERIEEEDDPAYPKVLFIIYKMVSNLETPNTSGYDVEARKYKLENNMYVLESGREKFESEAEAVIRITMEFPESKILKPKLKELHELGIHSIWNTFLKYKIYAGIDFEVVK